MSDQIIYSKHIFLFPFKWELKTTNDVEITSLLERTNLAVLKNNISNSWQSYNFRIEEPKAGASNPYNEHAYFYDHVRNVLNLEKSDEACQYTYKLDRKCFYKITILNTPAEIEFELEIDEIFLNFYRSGVAVLGFILTNRLEADFDRILKINEYGRRIYPQFLGTLSKDENGNEKQLTSDTKWNFLADKIELIGLKDKAIIESFAHYNTYAGIKDEYFKLPAHISELLGDKFKTRYEASIENKIQVTPIIDDRMFVMSLLFVSPPRTPYCRSKTIVASLPL